MELNIKFFNEIFKDDDTLITRQFENQQDNTIKCCIVLIEGMVNIEIINENIIPPIVRNTALKNREHTLESLQRQVIVSNNIEKTSDIDKLIEAIINGDTALSS